jgi:hypothetical protein
MTRLAVETPFRTAPRTFQLSTSPRQYSAPAPAARYPVAWCCALGGLLKPYRPGPAARAAFDGTVALAHGKRLQDAASAAAGRILPPSPYAADALSFVRGIA